MTRIRTPDAEQVRGSRRCSAAMVALGLTLILCGSPDIGRAAILYVSDSGDNTILKFTADGTGSVFASSGISNPRGLAFDASGNLFVANRGTNSILKITPNGVISSFANILSPVGIDFDSHGNLFVASNADNSIWKFTPAGIGSLFGRTQFQFPEAGPYGLAIDSRDIVYVSGFNEVEKFTSDGLLSVFVSGYSYVNNPYGLGVDTADNLYVVSYGSLRVEKFAPNGTGGRLAFTDLIPGFGYVAPRAVAVDNSGDFYVTNIGMAGEKSNIERFTASGNGSVFTNIGLNNPSFIAIQPAAVPEPCSALLVVAGLGWLGFPRRGSWC